jgi:hypothetical protein
MSPICSHADTIEAYFVDKNGHYGADSSYFSRIRDVVSVQCDRKTGWTIINYGKENKENGVNSGVTLKNFQIDLFAPGGFKNEYFIPLSPFRDMAKELGSSNIDGHIIHLNGRPITCDDYAKADSSAEVDDINDGRRARPDGFLLQGEEDSINLTYKSEIVVQSDGMAWIPLTVKKQSQVIKHYYATAIRCINDGWSVEFNESDPNDEYGYIIRYNDFDTKNGEQVFSDKSGKPLQCKDFQQTHRPKYND